MKKLLLMAFLCLFFSKVFSQRSESTQILINAFEESCPIYVLENYWSKTGFTDVMNEVKLDDRVHKIERINKKTQVADYLVKVKYNNNLLIFYQFEGQQKLNTLQIYFSNKEDMELFAKVYAHLLGFKGDAEGDRYYLQESPMNAITLHEEDGGTGYYALCFIFS